LFARIGPITGENGREFAVRFLCFCGVRVCIYMRFSVLLLGARKLVKFKEEDKGIHAMDTLGGKQ
jgi:hypothetical protein